MQVEEYVPAHRKITESVRRMVVTGFKPGEKLPTEGEMVKKFRVSRMTVRQALAPLVQEGMLHRKRGSGTFVSPGYPARAAAPGVKNIGVVFMDIYKVSHPFLSKILKGIGEACNERHCNLNLLTSPARQLNDERNTFLTKSITERHVDGVLLATRMRIEDIVVLKEEGVPLVSIVNDIPGRSFHCVLEDTVYGTYTAVKHVIDLNHRRIALILDVLSAGSSLNVFLTYKLVLENHGIEFDPELVKEGELGEEMGYKAMKELLAMPERPTAVLAGDDFTALGAISAIEDSGLKVPDDVAVMGAGDMVESRGMGLTTVDLHLDEIGRLSVDMLLKLLNGESIEQRKVAVRPELLIRESCGGKAFSGQASPMKTGSSA